METILVTPAAFAGVAGQVPTSVSIAIAMIDGEPFGTTVGSLVVISRTPPLIGVLARTGSRLERAITGAGRFTVSVLAEDQAALAGRLARADRSVGFGDHELIPRQSAPPVVAGSVAWIDCQLASTSEIGDHVLLIGRAIEAARNPARRPLTHYRGRWHRLTASESPNPFPTPADEQPYVW